MSFLKSTSSNSWLQAVLTHFDLFLTDHAAAEKKASGMALSMVSHYPDKIELVKTMTDIAIEELVHFKQVVQLMTERNIQLKADEKDSYVNQLRQHFRKGTDWYFLDRLIVGAIVEARGCERFSLISECLTDEKLKKYYRAISQSEQKHYQIFMDLAYLYFDKQNVDERVDELLHIEADILARLPIRATLH